MSGSGSGGASSGGQASACAVKKDRATPPPPPAGSAGSAGVKDPYVHLLESQSAMSMLMMQMAREMNQRSLQASTVERRAIWPRNVTDGGVLVFPVNPDSLGNREVIRGHSFRIREGVQFDV